jgi:hypothetical protein
MTVKFGKQWIVKFEIRAGSSSSPIFDAEFVWDP